MVLKTCGKCGQKNRPDARFCRICRHEFNTSYVNKGQDSKGRKAWLTWKSTESRFDNDHRICPYPNCECPIKDEVLIMPEENRPVMSWCDGCRRPFEVRASHVGPWPERPQTTFCTLTGREVTRLRSLNWSQYGGGPDRSNCVRDIQGQIFGDINLQVSFELKFNNKWNGKNGEDGKSVFRKEHGPCVSVSVVQGMVVAVSLRGAICVWDVETGRQIGNELVYDRIWNAAEISKGIAHIPAFIGTQMLMATRSCAYIYDLKQKYRDRVARPIRIQPHDGYYFPAHPLATGVQSNRLFCLLEYPKPNAEHNDPQLSFYNVQGDEIRKVVPCPDIVRGPIYDQNNDSILYVTSDMSIGQISLKDLKPEKFLHTEGNQQKSLEFSSHPLLALSLGDANTDGQLVVFGNSQVYRTKTKEFRQNREVQWARESKDDDFGLNPPNALSVAHRYDKFPADKRLIVISTDDKVHFIGRDHEPSLDSGSYDPALINAAGVVTRRGAFVSLKREFHDGYQDDVDPNIRLSDKTKAYDKDKGPRGFAQFGRNIFVATPQGVVCLKIERKENGDNTSQNKGGA